VKESPASSIAAQDNKVRFKATNFANDPVDFWEELRTKVPALGKGWEGPGPLGLAEVRNVVSRLWTKVENAGEKAL
jgi:hypothetical protein